MMPDFTRLSKRFKKGVASLQDVVRVYQAVMRLPNIIQALSSVGEGADVDECLRALVETTYLTALRVRRTSPLTSSAGLWVPLFRIIKTSSHNIKISWKLRSI